MRFESNGSVAVACARATSVVMLLAGTAFAHDGHVVGTGFAAAMVHAVEHAFGPLVTAAAGMAFVWRLRAHRRPARRLVRDRKFF